MNDEKAVTDEAGTKAKPMPERFVPSYFHPTAGDKGCWQDLGWELTWDDADTVLMEARRKGYSVRIDRIPADGSLIQTPPPGHIIDESGTVRKVLGTLPISADGCVVGSGSELWFPQGCEAIFSCYWIGHVMTPWTVGTGYSSKQAAREAERHRRGVTNEEEGPRPG